MNNSPSWYECKFCDYKKICHDFAAPDINCRTCMHSVPGKEGNWHCTAYATEIDKERQLSGCEWHIYDHNLLNGARLTKDCSDDNYIRILWREQEVFLGNTKEQGVLTSQEFKERNV